MTVIIFGSFNKMGPAFGTHADEAFQSPLCCIHAVLGAFGAERVIWWLLEGLFFSGMHAFYVALLMLIGRQVTPQSCRHIECHLEVQTHPLSNSLASSLLCCFSPPSTSLLDDSPNPRCASCTVFQGIPNKRYCSRQGD